MLEWLSRMFSVGAGAVQNPTGMDEDMANTGDPRVPAGQYLTDKFPVLTFGSTPKVDMATWEFKVTGLVEEELTWSWDEFKALPATAMTSDFHCVTQWSQLDNAWEGVTIQDIMKLIKPLPDASHVMLHCYGGYTTNLSLSDLQAGGRRPRSRSRWPAATHRPQALRVEERQVGQRHRVHGSGQARLLGTARIPHGR